MLRCVMGDVQMANSQITVNQKHYGLSAAGKRVQRLVNQLPQSSHFQFLSTKPFAAVGEDIEDLKKLTVMGSLNKRFLLLVM